MTGLEILFENCPDWVEAEPDNESFRVIARLISKTGSKLPEITLIVSFLEVVRVREISPPLFPKFCPERHINGDSTFCLGKGTPLRPSSHEEARAWWNWLEKYLRCQFFASKNGSWPLERGLHHGEAAEVQLEMENRAKGTRFEADVRAALDHGKGWLSTEASSLDVLADFVAGDGQLSAAELVSLEKQRRSAEAEFWRAASWSKCCETMHCCPLRQKQVTPNLG